MPDVNKANRQVCDLLISDLKTGIPFMKFDTANTTTVGLSADSVYAMAKGSRRIAFQNPLEGAMSLSAQVTPFKFYSLYSDGVIESEGSYTDTQTVTCATDGEITLNVPEDGTIVAGTVFAFPADSFGEEGAVIEGEFSDNKFTAEGLKANAEYTVGYTINRTGVKKVSFNNKKIPRDYKITMSTLDKDENGLLTPFQIVAYKASIQRSFELSFSSEGEPAELTATLNAVSVHSDMYVK